MIVNDLQSFHNFCIRVYGINHDAIFIQIVDVFRFSGIMMTSEYKANRLMKGLELSKYAQCDIYNFYYLREMKIFD